MDYQYHIFAPYRVCPLGAHVDHQHGLVTGFAIDKGIDLWFNVREDSLVKLSSRTFEGDVEFHVNTPSQVKEKHWDDYVRGAKYALRKRFELSHGIEGIIQGSLPVGGLSSSAAFEVAIGNVLSGLYNDMKLTAVYIAKVSQYAENVYFGKPCGLMDQMASSVGSLVNIDFYDVNEPVINPVRVDFEKFGHSLCIVDTKGDHADLTDDYAAIPIEMKKVAGFFGKEYLKEIPFDEFLDKIPQIRPVSGDRAVLRAIHFFEDDMRVTDEVNALKNGDFEEFKRLITESGNSSYKYLQNVYSIKDYDNQNISLALVLTERYLGSRAGYRVHGGGFAGTIQVFVPNDLVSGYKKEIEKVENDGESLY